MRDYLYRRGDGNEGNFIRALVTLADEDCPYRALKALLANDYIPGRGVRRWIIAKVEIDGEADYGVHATVYEGPKGEQAFGAAYITAELEPLTEADATYYRDSLSVRGTLRDLLDSGAWRMYRKEKRAA